MTERAPHRRARSQSSCTIVHDLEERVAARIERGSPPRVHAPQAAINAVHLGVDVLDVAEPQRDHGHHRVQ
ncbi:MAG: hypothetical protein IPK74_23810 [Deltaproteobacteria bacterium]|nr:hypothetical protein [Deltaproteobacteria bacterium]